MLGLRITGECSLSHRAERMSQQQVWAPFGCAAGAHRWLNGWRCCIDCVLSVRYFYNFLVWLWLGCLFLMSVTLPLIAFPTEAQQSFLYGRGADGLPTSHEGLIFFVLVLTAAAACAVGALLALHSFLVLTNQTTIEMYSNGKKKAQARRRGEVNQQHTRSRIDQDALHSNRETKLIVSHRVRLADCVSCVTAAAPRCSRRIGSICTTWVGVATGRRFWAPGRNCAARLCSSRRCAPDRWASPLCTATDCSTRSIQT